MTGRWLVLLAAALWSSSGLFAKAPLLDSMETTERVLNIAFWRCAFAGCALLPLVRRPHFSWPLVLLGIAFATMSISFIASLSTTTAANAIWLQYSAPLWVVFLGYVVLSETPSRDDVWMICSSLLGVFLILTCEMWRAIQLNTDPQGVAWGLLSGLAFAAVVVLLRHSREHDAYWVMAWNFLVTALLLAPWMLRWGLPEPRQVGWLGMFGIVQMGLPYILFSRGLRTVPSYEASVICLIEPLLVPLWVFLAWRHTSGYSAPAWWTWVGGLFILAGMLYRYRDVLRQRQRMP